MSHEHPETVARSARNTSGIGGTRRIGTVSTARRAGVVVVVSSYMLMLLYRLGLN